MKSLIMVFENEAVYLQNIFLKAMTCYSDKRVNANMIFCRLKVKEIQDRLTKLDAAASLRTNAEEFLIKMRTYVYPCISGKDHALLLALFTLVQQCCGDDAVLEVCTP